jgi:hypothetical protein
MRAGGYIAVPARGGPRIMKVEGMLPTHAVMLALMPEERLYYAKGKFFVDEKLWKEFPTTGGWIEVPVFLEAHVSSNAMIQWAQTKFDERAFALQETKA